MFKVYSEKEREALANEILKIAQLDENKFCAECGTPRPRWTSYNLGIFICMRCAAVHRNVGVNISRVKSVTLDNWTREQVEAIKSVKLISRNLFLIILADPKMKGFISFKLRSIREFIKNKYELKKYVKSKIPFEEFTLGDSSKPVESHTPIKQDGSKKPLVQTDLMLDFQELEPPSNKPSTQNKIDTSDLLSLFQQPETFQPQKPSINSFVSQNQNISLFGETPTIHGNMTNPTPNNDPWMAFQMPHNTTNQINQQNFQKIDNTLPNFVNPFDSSPPKGLQNNQSAAFESLFSTSEFSSSNFWNQK